MTTITQPKAQPSAEYVSAAAQFVGLASNHHAGVDSLWIGWQRLRAASARMASDPLADCAFGSALDHILDWRSAPGRFGAFEIATIPRTRR